MRTLRKVSDALQAERRDNAMLRSRLADANQQVTYWQGQYEELLRTLRREAPSAGVRPS